MMNKIESRNYCVYVHTSPSGKRYVGQTGRLPEVRFGKNGCHYLSKRKNGIYTHPAFAKAILKYGWENFKHEIIADNLTKEEADVLEQSLIKKWNTMNFKYGYNCVSGGSKGIPSEETRKRQSEAQKGEKSHKYGTHLSEETKRKLSKAHKGKIVSLETRKKISENNKGRKHSEETKRKMSEAQKGKILSEAHKKKISESHMGIKPSEETRKKLSESHKGIKQSEETVRKRAEKLKGENNPNYGKPMSEETKRKLSKAHKGRKQSEETIRKRVEKLKGKNNPNYGKPLSEEHKKKLSEALKGKKHSEETKRKISEATKGTKNPFYGKRHSEESLRKMSESHKGQNVGGKHFNSKKIIQYDSQGLFIKLWDCISDVERELNINSNGVSNCCRGLQKKAGGFIWRYKNDKITDEYLAWCNELHTGRNHKKPVEQYSLNNEFICLFDSICEAEAKTGVDVRSISACCRGKSKTAKGFIWKFHDGRDIESFT